MRAASSRSGGASRAARPDRAHLAGERLAGGVARAREGVDLAALVLRDLHEDVRGRAEAVQPEAPAVRRARSAR